MTGAECSVTFRGRTMFVLYSNRFLKQNREIAGYILFLFNM